MTNICGHDRETLRWALRFKNTPGVTCGGGVVPPDARQSAAIIAKLMRDRGIETTPKSGDLTFWSFTGEQQRLIRYAIELPLLVGNTWQTFMLTMSQARAFALALLGTPNASAHDIKRMVEAAK